MRKFVLLASVSVVLSNVSGMNPNEKIRILRQQNSQMQDTIKYLCRANSVQRDEINRLRKVTDSQTEKINNLKNENVSQMDTINYLKNANDFQANAINDLLSISNYYCGTNGYLLREAARWRNQCQLISDFSSNLQGKLGYEEDSYYEEVAPIEIDENGFFTYNCESGEIFPTRGEKTSPRRADISSRRFSMPGGLWSLENTEHQYAFNARSVKFNRDKEVGKNLSIDKKDERQRFVTAAEQVVSPVVREAIESSKQLGNSENQKFLLDLFNETEGSSSEVDVTQPETESLNRENSEKNLSEEKNNENQTEIEAEEKLLAEEDSKNPLLIQKDTENTLETSAENTNKTLIEKQNVDKITEKMDSELKPEISEENLAENQKVEDEQKDSSEQKSKKKKKKKKKNQKGKQPIQNNVSFENDRNFSNILKSVLSDKVFFKYQLPLLRAIKEGELDKVVHFVKIGADVNYLYSDGVNPLNTAISLGQSEIVSFLIAQGADFDEWTEMSDSLIESMVVGFYKQNKKFWKGKSPDKLINVLKAQRQAELLQRLVIEALRTGNLAAIKDMKNQGMNPNSRIRVNGVMLSLLDYAIQVGQAKIIEYLVDEKADSNIFALNEEEIEKTIRKSFEVNKEAWREVSLDTIIDKIKAENNRRDELISLVEAMKTGDLDKVKNLRDEGVDLNYTFWSGETLLDYAIQVGQAEIIEYFLKLGMSSAILKADEREIKAEEKEIEESIFKISEQNKEVWQGNSDQIIDLIKAEKQRRKIEGDSRVVI